MEPPHKQSSNMIGKIPLIPSLELQDPPPQPSNPLSPPHRNSNNKIIIIELPPHPQPLSLEQEFENKLLI
jgi:hypothetical protein